MKSTNGSPFEIRKKGTSNEELSSQLVEHAKKLDTKEINVLAPPAPFVAAKGDGVTNDSTAIQNIVDTLSNKGMRLYFPLGTYLIGAKLNLVSKLHLIGAKGTVFKLGTTSGMIDISWKSDITLESIIFDGNNVALTSELLGFYNSNNIVVDKCSIINTKHHAILSYETSLVVKDSIFTDITKEAIRLDSSKPATIERTTITNATNAGIEVANGSATPKNVTNIFRHNNISNISSTGGTGENGNGIVVHKVNGGLITHNVISQTAWSAIRLANSGDTLVSSNKINNAGDWSIYAEFGGKNVVISDNLIIDSNGGISCTNSDVGGKMMMVSGNTLRNITDSAIDIEDSTVVTGNNIDGAKWGIRMGWGAYGKNLIVTSNIITDTKTTPTLKVGIVVNKNAAMTDFIITQNIIKNFINYGICGADLTVNETFYNTPAFAVTANNIPAPF